MDRHETDDNVSTPILCSNKLRKEDRETKFMLLNFYADAYDRKQAMKTTVDFSCDTNEFEENSGGG